MALYGAMLATTSGGASVSVERSQGWTRQLRLTPLRPATYVFTKVAVAMVMGLAAVVVVAIVGLASGATGDAGAIAASLGLAWVGSVVFAAFGLFMGYLLPAENVMQILGPVLALLAFAGGLFVPLGDGSLRRHRQGGPDVRARRDRAGTPDGRRAEHLGRRQRRRVGCGVRRRRRVAVPSRHGSGVTSTPTDPVTVTRLAWAS